MIWMLLVILVLTLALPFIVKKVEHNLELFLFVMGLSSVLVTGGMSHELIGEIFKNHFLYMITAAVLIAGVAFKYLKNSLKRWIRHVLKHISLRLFVFLLIVVLGLLSSMVTAIISSLVLVEIVMLLPMNKLKKVEINIVACFSIGLGAALTPIGEPLSTIVVSKLGVGFFYIAQALGAYIIPGIVLLGFVGVWFVGDKSIKSIFKRGKGTIVDQELNALFGAEDFAIEDDDFAGILFRTFKIFIFIIALELLGAGFKPVIDTYVIKIDSHILYWGNMLSAILDNATLAAAEISPKMSPIQIKAILMGLLISGGMLVPGNIPNIVSASKLKIKSSEWARIGVPLGLALMVLYFVILYFPV